MAWGYEKEQVQRRNMQWTHLNETGIPGTEAFIATVNSMPMPVGIIWFRWNTRRTIGIMNIYVLESLRRQGVATWLHNKLVEVISPDCVYTMSANDMSEPWLTKLGYEKADDGWYLYPQKS
jgi:GNAT superfamily N-acetyltransferase